MKPVTRLSAAAALVAPLLLAGCGDDAAAGSGPRIVTSYYALQYLAERVAGDHATVVNLTEPGQEPHDLELSLRQVAEVDEADVLLYQRGFQGAVDDAVDTVDPVHVVDAAQVVGLPSDGDPHIWLSPESMVATASALTSELADLDPDHRSDFEANLEALRADVNAVKDEYVAGLAECRIDTVVVSHDAFRNLPASVSWASINGLSPHSEPSPAHIAKLRDLIEREGITTVFNEELASAQMADTLAADLGLETAVLDPIEGLSDDTADEDYLSLMRKNLAALRKANDCT